jgi:lysophospholipid acyltransferase (LPLAT)-like uncharacterized protein
MESPSRTKFFLIRKLSRLLINAIIMTCRLEVKGVERIQPLLEGEQPVIYIFWHRHILVNIYKFKNTGASPLISMSQDGELVAQVAEEFGMQPVRGSSSRGGARAFLEMVNAIRRKTGNREILITADGPKGPARQLKDGAVVLAQKTGAVLVPITWHASRVKVFEKSWDQFMIPKPFSKILFQYGEPSTIDRRMGKDGICNERDRLETVLNDLEHETQQYFKET